MTSHEINITLPSFGKGKRGLNGRDHRKNWGTAGKTDGETKTQKSGPTDRSSSSLKGSLRIENTKLGHTNTFQQAAGSGGPWGRLGHSWIWEGDVLQPDPPGGPLYLHQPGPRLQPQVGAALQGARRAVTHQAFCRQVVSPNILSPCGLNSTNALKPLAVFPVTPPISYRECSPSPAPFSPRRKYSGYGSHPAGHKQVEVNEVHR